MAVALVFAAGYGLLHETTRFPSFGILFWTWAGAMMGLGAERETREPAWIDPS